MLAAEARSAAGCARRALIESAVLEEIVRCTTPATVLAHRDARRRAAQQTIRAGCGQLRQSGNRDEEVFDHPFEFASTGNPTRSIACSVSASTSARRHLARWSCFTLTELRCSRARSAALPERDRAVAHWRVPASAHRRRYRECTASQWRLASPEKNPKRSLCANLQRTSQPGCCSSRRFAGAVQRVSGAKRQLFKNALVILVAFTSASPGHRAASSQARGAAILILPFSSFSVRPARRPLPRRRASSVG